MKTRTMWNMMPVTLVVGMSLAMSVMAADVTLTASRDAYIESGPDAASNFGTTESLRVKNTGANYTRHSYITFDLSGLTGQVASATLSVAAQGTQTGGSTTSVEYLTDGGSESWGETTITWNNIPAASANSLGSFTWNDADPDGTWYTCASGQLLVNAINTDSNGEITFVLKCPTADSTMIILNSREHADYRPKLEITYVTEDPAVLTPSADSYTYKNQPDVNFGNSDTLLVKTVNNYDRHSYITFDLSRLSRQVTMATLSVAAQGTQTGGSTTSVGYLTDGGSESWGETTITWNNKPAATTNLLGSFNWNDGDPDGTWYSYSGQRLVNAINTDSNDKITFVLRGSYANVMLSLKSKENVDKYPKLELTYAATNTVVYTPSRDTYVDANDADSNFGSGDKMLIKNSSPYIRHAYIAFDISSVPPEYDGCILSGARLSVSAAGTQTGGSQVLVNYLTNGVDESWDENTITWNNKPAAAANLLGSFNWSDGDPDGTWYSYSGQNLIDAVNADTNGEITFVLTGGISENKMLYLTSKEGDGYYAKLELTYTPPQGTLIIIR